MPITKQGNLLYITGEEQADLLPRLRRAAEYAARKEENRKLRNFVVQGLVFAVLLVSFLLISYTY